MAKSNRSESVRQQKARMKKIIVLLQQAYPETQVGLRHNNVLELLIAVMLSAQCTDERVDQVTEHLFKKYRSPADYLRVPQEELERDIFSTGFYKAKARNIRGACKAIIERFGGEVPGTLEELTSLPGVGRKTANVVLAHWFDEQTMIVDTHVTRLANLLGFTQSKDAEVIEQELMKIVPKEDWVQFTHLLITHGRQVCIARRPRCSECVLVDLCPSAFNV